MDIVNTGKTAEPFAITLRTETYHDNFLSSVRGALLAEGLIFDKAHLSKIYNIYFITNNQEYSKIYKN